MAGVILAMRNESVDDSDSENGNAETEDQDNAQDKQSLNTNSEESESVSEYMTFNSSGSFSKSTEKCVRFAVGLLKYWCEANGESTDIESMPWNKLNEVLAEFYKKVRTKTGEIYSVSSLVSFRYSLNRYFQSLGPRKVDIIENSAFAHCNEVYSNVVKSMKKTFSEQSMCSNEKTYLSPDDLRQIYTQVFSTDSPKTLQFKVWMEVAIYFTKCGRQKQKFLTKNSFEFGTDSSGRYVTLKKIPETDAKYIFHNLTREGRKMYERKGNPFCPVLSLTKYLSKLNPNGEDLFQRPKYKVSESSHTWYYHQPVGKNYLGNVMSMICQQAGIARHVSNKCLKSITPQVLDVCVFSLPYSKLHQMPIDRPVTDAYNANPPDSNLGQMTDDESMNSMHNVESETSMQPVPRHSNMPCSVFRECNKPSYEDSVQMQEQTGTSISLSFEAAKQEILNIVHQLDPHALSETIRWIKSEDFAIQPVNHYTPSHMNEYSDAVYTRVMPHSPYPYNPGMVLQPASYTQNPHTRYPMSPLPLKPQTASPYTNISPPVNRHLTSSTVPLYNYNYHGMHLHQPSSVHGSTTSNHHHANITSHAAIYDHRSYQLDSLNYNNPTFGMSGDASQINTEKIPAISNQHSSCNGQGDTGSFSRNNNWNNSALIGCQNTVEADGNSPTDNNQHFSGSKTAVKRKLADKVSSNRRSAKNKKTERRGNGSIGKKACDNSFSSGVKTRSTTSGGLKNYKSNSNPNKVSHSSVNNNIPFAPSTSTHEYSGMCPAHENVAKSCTPKRKRLKIEPITPQPNFKIVSVVSMADPGGLKESQTVVRDDYYRKHLHRISPENRTWSDYKTEEATSYFNYLGLKLIPRYSLRDKLQNSCSNSNNGSGHKDHLIPVWFDNEELNSNNNNSELESLQSNTITEICAENIDSNCSLEYAQSENQEVDPINPVCLENERKKHSSDNGIVGKESLSSVSVANTTGLESKENDQCKTNTTSEFESKDTAKLKKRNESRLSLKKMIKSQNQGSTKELFQDLNTKSQVQPLSDFHKTTPFCSQCDTLKQKFGKSPPVLKCCHTLKMIGFSEDDRDGKKSPIKMNESKSNLSNKQTYNKSNSRIKERSRDQSLEEVNKTSSFPITSVPNEHYRNVLKKQLHNPPLKSRVLLLETVQYDKMGDMTAADQLVGRSIQHTLQRNESDRPTPNISTQDFSSSSDKHRTSNSISEPQNSQSDESQLQSIVNSKLKESKPVTINVGCHNDSFSVDSALSTNEFVSAGNCNTSATSSVGSASNSAEPFSVKSNIKLIEKCGISTGSSRLSVPRMTSTEMAKLQKLLETEMSKIVKKNQNAKQTTKKLKPVNSQEKRKARGEKTGEKNGSMIVDMDSNNTLVKDPAVEGKNTDLTKVSSYQINIPIPPSIGRTVSSTANRPSVLVPPCIPASTMEMFQKPLILPQLSSSRVNVTNVLQSIPAPLQSLTSKHNKFTQRQESVIRKCGKTVSSSQNTRVSSSEIKTTPKVTINATCVSNASLRSSILPTSRARSQVLASDSLSQKQVPILNPGNLLLHDTNSSDRLNNVSNTSSSDHPRSSQIPIVSSQKPVYLVLDNGILKEAPTNNLDGNQRQQDISLTAPSVGVNGVLPVVTKPNTSTTTECTVKKSCVPILIKKKQLTSASLKPIPKRPVLAMPVQEKLHPNILLPLTMNNSQGCRYQNRSYPLHPHLKLLEAPPNAVRNSKMTPTSADKAVPRIPRKTQPQKNPESRLSINVQALNLIRDISPQKSKTSTNLYEENKTFRAVSLPQLETSHTVHPHRRTSISPHKSKASTNLLEEYPVSRAMSLPHLKTSNIVHSHRRTNSWEKSTFPVNYGADFHMSQWRSLTEKAHPIEHNNTCESVKGEKSEDVKNNPGNEIVMKQEPPSPESDTRNSVSQQIPSVSDPCRKNDSVSQQNPSVSGPRRNNDSLAAFENVTYSSKISSSKGDSEESKMDTIGTDGKKKNRLLLKIKLSDFHKGSKKRKSYHNSV